MSDETKKPEFATDSALVAEKPLAEKSLEERTLHSESPQAAVVITELQEGELEAVLARAHAEGCRTCGAQAPQGPVQLGGHFPHYFIETCADCPGGVFSTGWGEPPTEAKELVNWLYYTGHELHHQKHQGTQDTCPFQACLAIRRFFIKNGVLGCFPLSS